MNALKTEAGRLNRMKDTIQRKLRTVEDHKSEVEASKETLKGNITALERGMILLRFYRYSLSLDVTTD